MRYIAFLFALSLYAGGVPPGAHVVTVCASGCDQTTLLGGYNAAVTDAETNSRAQWVKLTQGETFAGATLPTRNRNGYPIYITSSACTLEPGTRIAYNNTANIATINTALLLDIDFTGTDNFNNVVFDCLKVTASAASTLSIVQMDYNNGGSLAQRPETWPLNVQWRHMIISPAAFTTTCRNSITLSGDRIGIYDSWIDGCHDTQETHSVYGINIGQFVTYQNNAIWGLGTSINHLVGGANPVQKGNLPINFQVIGNWWVKPFQSRFTSGTSNPSGTCFTDPDKDGTVGAGNLGEFYLNTMATTYWQCQGTSPSSGSWVEIMAAAYNAADDWKDYIKNNFEFKNASNAVVEGNIFEGGWYPGYQGQKGACVLINLVDNDPGQSLYTFQAQVRNVIFRNNIMKNCGIGVQQGGINTYSMNEVLTFWNNLFWNIGPSQLMTSPGAYTSSFFQMSSLNGGEANAPYPRWKASHNTGLNTVTNTTKQIGVLMANSGNSGTVVVVDNSFDDYPFGNSENGGFLWNNMYNAYSTNLISTAGNLYPLVNASPSNSRSAGYNVLLQPQDTAPVGNINGWGNKPYSYLTSSPLTWQSQSDTYTNTATADLSIKSPYAGTATIGGNAGVYANELLAATGCATLFSESCSVVSGTLSSFLKYMAPPRVSVAAGSVTVTYNSVSTSQQCTTALSTRANMASPTTGTDTTGTYYRTKTVSVAAGRYFGTVTCGTGNERNFGPILVP